MTKCEISEITVLQMPSSETVAESSYRQIKADIIFGRLAPGQKLKLENLKAAYHTSVSTLREILNQLTSEGLVIAEGQRGFEVSPASRKELAELADLRSVLETHAIALSFAAGNLEARGGGTQLLIHRQLCRMGRS
jgi:DNA-binding GntR family transcriptional regulator